MKMKRLAGFGLAALMALSLAGCGGKQFLHLNSLNGRQQRGIAEY